MDPTRVENKSGIPGYQSKPGVIYCCTAAVTSFSGAAVTSLTENLTSFLTIQALYCVVVCCVLHGEHAAGPVAAAGQLVEQEQLLHVAAGRDATSQVGLKSNTMNRYITFLAYSYTSTCCRKL